MAKKKLYYIYDGNSNRNWVVMAKSAEKAEKKVMEDLVDYFSENEFDFITTESELGAVELNIGVEVL